MQMEFTKSQCVDPKSSLLNIDRKTFADITNTLQHPRSVSHGDIPPPPADEFSDKLLKENLAMMRIIEEKNKLIELSGVELHNMRIHLQKLKLQNWNLAQSNSQMQAEVNVGRQRLKSLQHELACKDAMFKAKNGQEEKQDMEMNKTHSEVKMNCENHQQLQLQVINDEKKLSHDNTNHRVIRSRSMSISSSSIKQSPEQEPVETKRLRMRRQSANFKSEEHRENLFETEEVQFSNSCKKTQNPMRRSSIGGGSRPCRKAAEKVQSYKETPLNVKLRRKD